jgi:hypothetical protein
MTFIEGNTDSQDKRSSRHFELCNGERLRL